MQQPTDSGIPTLTQRAEQTTYQPFSRQNNDIPVLTKVAPPNLLAGNPPTTSTVTPRAQPSVMSASSPDTSEPASIVLRSALQAEIEHFLEQAIEEATTHIRARLDAELPAIIERAINQVRPG